MVSIPRKHSHFANKDILQVENYFVKMVLSKEPIKLSNVDGRSSKRRK